MTEQKKIAVNLNVRINVGNYQYIDKTVYAEKTIEYENTDEMVAKEDALTEEALQNLIRNMRRIPERLNKGSDAVQDVEDRTVKAIPEWLKDGEVPNIANGAKSNHDKVTAEQKEKSEEQKRSTQEVDGLFDGDDDSSTKSEEPKEESEPAVEELGSNEDDDLKDLFDD